MCGRIVKIGDAVLLPDPPLLAGEGRGKWLSAARSPSR